MFQLYDLSSGELLCSFVFDVGVRAVIMDPSEQNLFAGCVNGNIYQVELSKMVGNFHDFFGNAYTRSFCLSVFLKKILV